MRPEASAIFNLSASSAASLLDYRAKTVGNTDNALLRHLRVNGKQDRVVLSQFRSPEIMKPLLACIGLLAMRAHDAAARRDPLVEKLLHDIPLIDAVGQAYAVALPVGPRPLGFGWQ